MLIKIVLIIVWLFILNIWLYFTIPSYSSFIKDIKYNKIEQNQDLSKEDPIYNQEIYSNNSLLENILIDEKPQKNDIDTSSWKQNIIHNNDLYNNKDYSSILNSFSNYNLSKIDYNPDYKMFYLTSEYFPEYITYSWTWIDLYIYNNDSFLNIYNFFEEVKEDIKVSINKTNTFWKQSFFINKDTQDNRVRLVINYNYILIWLNIDKSYYENIKEILKKF